MKHIKLYCYALAFTGLTINSYAQINIGGTPYAWSNTFKAEVEMPIVITPLLDMQKIKAEDDNDERNG